MNNEQKRLIIDLLNVHKDDVRDGIATTDDNRTVEQELEFVDELLQHPDLQLERCLAGYVTGGQDPFGTDCDNENPSHEGPHEGPDPIDPESGRRVRWEGGGFCAGDPLPYRNVQYIDA